MGAAIQLTEHARAATRSVQETGDVRDCLRALADLSKYDPQQVFSHTVREHREAVAALDDLLCSLCFDGQHIETAASEAGFGREALTAIRAVHMKLRVLRTLALVLSGDRSALASDGAEVQAEVTRAIERRAAGNIAKWTDEEREAFGGSPRPFSQELEARLVGS